MKPLSVNANGKTNGNLSYNGSVSLYFGSYENMYMRPGTTVPTFLFLFSSFSYVGFDLKLESDSFLI